MKLNLIFPCLLLGSPLFSQGLINNGAQIVFANNGHLYVSGGTNGNYTNQSGGLLKNGGGNGLVHLEGDWINNAANVASSNDGITTELRGGSQAIRGSNSTTFYNLTLSGSGTKTLQINTKAGGISTLTGVVALNDRPLDLNQHTLEITNPNTTAFTRTNGYVISETPVASNPSIIQWNTGGTGNYVFPFGVAGVYIPIQLNRTTAGSSNIKASTRATATNMNTPWTTGVTNMTSVVLGLTDASKETVIDRWYEIDPSTAITGDLTLTYRGVENTTTFDPTGNFAMQHWSGHWENQMGSGPGVTSGTAAVTANGVTAFSTFVLSTLNAYGPLPVELTDFTANCSDHTVILHWTTASENNASNYIIERSRDLEHWENIGTVDAVGNSSQTNQYELADNSPINETAYYRLIQTDNNGKSKIYGPISTTCESQTNSLNVYPNPANSEFNVAITNANNQEMATISLFDLSGKLIQSKSVVVNSGTNLFNFDFSQLAQGSYIVRVLSTDNFKPVKIVKL